MAKTQEELNQLKTEYETLNNKLKELSEKDLEQVSGGINKDKIRELLEEKNNNQG